MLNFWEVWERAEGGPECREKEFDMLLYKRAKELKIEYGIKFDIESPVPIDINMAKDVYQAGLTLFLDLGTLYTNSERLIKVTDEEVKLALKEAPKWLKLGAGKEAVRMERTAAMKEGRTLIAGGPCECPVSEEIYLETMLSYAKEPMVDVLFSGLLKTINGRDVQTHTPLEMASARYEAKIAREALKEVGREGLCIAGLVHPTAEATNFADCTIGLRLTDIHEIDPLNELKMDLETFKRAYHCRENGYIISSMMCPVLGGYAGGAEELAITSVAEALQGYTNIGGHIFQLATNHINYKTGAEKGSLWAGAIALLGIKLCTKLLTGNLMWTAAGPCTEMQCLEIVAKSIADTVCGANIITSAGGTGGRLVDHYTGMEARIAAMASKTASGMNLDEANSIVKSIIELYDKEIVEGRVPQGKTIMECYDMRNVEPSVEYVSIWKNTRKKLADLGFEILD